ncbi:hypothetical protein [Enhygromyxa salina]|uniref:Uncharacterized protein n=1 Tax=Enhygromyxa salina TaxID=215803 RepID=A0A2S9YJ57_9BACT|nr:hypothetical protein [Enhygromyxa salina]PRQ05101.1 hypothetical protein ENSA7_47300 [Enhygromyxa salina]
MPARPLEGDFQYCLEACELSPDSLALLEASLTCAAVNCGEVCGP